MIAAEAAPRVAARAPLDLRRIGGSDVAAILGVSDYSSPFDVWLRIVEGFKGEQTVAMKLGLRFERAIADWWCERAGVEIAWFDSFHHPDREWQRLSPDVRVTTSPGEIADIKRSRRALDRHGHPGTDDLADYELCQLQTYLEALHSMGEPAEVGHLVVHDLEHDELFTWHTRRDPEFGALIVEACERFWRDHVLTKKPPPMSGSETAKAWLEKRRPRDTTPARAATPEELRLALEYRDVHGAIKQLEERESVLKNQLRESIGTARGLRGPFGSISYAAIEVSTATDWEAVAVELAKMIELERVETAAEHDHDLDVVRLVESAGDRAIALIKKFREDPNYQRIARQAHRRLAPSWKRDK